jgi:hypothetical protein
MIGGFAVNLYGFNRATNDIDIWIEDTIENRQNFGKCLLAYDYEDVNWDTLDFVPGWTNFKINHSLYLDVLTKMKGLDNYTFEECLSMATIAEIDDVKVPFLHINHLIKNKTTTNRPKDRIDVAALEEIKNMREKE